jgi:hypothetical protein
MRILGVLTFIIFALNAKLIRAEEAPHRQVNAMAPLFVGDRLHFNPSGAEWQRFKHDLGKLKSLGVKSVTVDVWWGHVHRSGLDPKQADWTYYDHIFGLIRAAGLKIIPILSTHACGGNVGDRVNDKDLNIPLPAEVLDLLPNFADGLDARYHSEGGNISQEVISAHADARPLFLPFWTGFRDHYAAIAMDMPEIAVSLGPAGELTYPSYHAHDRDLKGWYEKSIAHFPHRGALQASSPLSRQKFYEWLKGKYGSIRQVNQAWGTGYLEFSDITFFTNVDEVEDFLGRNRQYSRQGQDFFDWYHSSLMESGRRNSQAFIDVFGASDSAFKDAVVSHKVPGIYWNSKRRLALLTAGQISTEGASLDESLPAEKRAPAHWNFAQGLGLSTMYRDFFIPLRKENPNTKVMTVYTCGEQPNCNLHHMPGAADSSLEPRDLIAYDMVRAMLELSLNMTYMGADGNTNMVKLGLENSIEDNLYFPHDVARMENHALTNPNVLNVTYLRMATVANGPEFLHESLRRILESRCEDLLRAKK